MKLKKCKECGSTFVPRNGTQVYCNGPHFSVCKICGKPIEYTCSPKEKPTYCSPECRKEGKRLTVQARYGVDNVSQLLEVQQKISKINSSAEVSSRRKATCIAKYGVDNVSKDLEVKKKLSAVMKTERYLKGREKTCLERYGFANPMQAQQTKDKQRQTYLDRYGTPGHIPTRDELASRILDGSKVDNYIAFKDDPISYIDSNYKSPPSIVQLEKDLGVTNTPIYNILVEHNCSDLIQHSFSHIEDAVVDFLLSIDPDIKIKRNDRTMIKPLELDIYLPDYRLAIECNPAATHNSSISDPWTGTKKSYRYHQNKSNECAKNDIFLFHIFGYEWNLKKNVIKSMIQNLLHKNVQTIGARATYVCEVSQPECSNFLAGNHRQGSLSAKVRLGLKLKSTNELVSVMTFNHIRNTIGSTHDTNEGDWELSRFCNLCGITVVGAASKLFQYFIHNYKFNKIISFSDIAHTKGTLYSILGFKQISISEPSYVWTDIYDTKYLNRVSCQKKNLPSLFNEPDLDIENFSEAQIMEAHKYVRVYDSGVIRWEYSNI